MAHLDLIIFDCDGVLIDSEMIACRADAACLAEIGITMSAEEILERYVGISAAAMFSDIEQRRGRLRHSLSLTGLLRYFDPHIFSATQVARGKPAPGLFVFAAGSMPAAAVAAGMRVIGFAGGGHCRPGHADRLRAAGAFAVCDAMRALPAMVASA
jgi:beta-phosphoglucomutase-like phosphatase (HAD superfamily)